MTPKSFISYCYNRMAANWSYTPIQYQDSQILDHQDLDEFVKFSVLFNSIKGYSHNTKPNKLIRGIVVCAIFTRFGQGPGRKYELFELYNPIFDQLIDNPNRITFYATQPDDQGNKISGETEINPDWTVLHCVTDFVVGYS